MSAAPPEPVLREIRFEDLGRCQDLERRVGFGTTPADYWNQLWRNPVLSANRAKVSPGWVLEAGGRIVGHFGNIPMLYAYGDRTLMVAAAKGVYVDPVYRGRNQAAKLASRFFGQDNVDLVISTTTNSVAGRFFLRFEALRIPQPGYDTALYWVTDPREFLRVVLRKRRRSLFAARLASRLLAPALRADIAVRRKRPAPSSVTAPIDYVSADDIGPEFDDLWNRKRSEDPRLLAHRTSELLRWHFDKPTSRRAATVVRCHRENRLVGYAITLRLAVDRIGLIRSRIVDLFVEGDEPAVIDHLLRAAYDHATTTGCHILELIGFPRAVRHRASVAKPYSRRLPSWPYFYKALKPDLRSDLQRESTWYASPFDGDGSLRGE